MTLLHTITVLALGALLLATIVLVVLAVAALVAQIRADATATTPDDDNPNEEGQP